jgi:hypothetical protein
MTRIVIDTVTGNVNGTLIVTSRLIEEASQPLFHNSTPST